MKVFLIGFMGCGKSTVAKRIASLANYTAIDLDDVIETKTNKSIAQIFTDHGEAQFRILEKESLYQLTNAKESIIATGGGTPCFFDNLAWMKKHGVVIYLKATPKLLLNRLKGQQSKRPLLAGKSEKELLRFIEEKLEERSTIYEQAAIVYEQISGKEKVAEDLHKYFFK